MVTSVSKRPMTMSLPLCLMRAVHRPLSRMLTPQYCELLCLLPGAAGLISLTGLSGLAGLMSTEL